jgi:hypothetical protein
VFPASTSLIRISDISARNELFKSLGLSQIKPVHRYTRRTDRNQTGSGLFHPIVKEQVLPGQLAGLKTNPDTTEACPNSQAIIQIYFDLFCAPSAENIARLWASPIP